MTNNEPQSQPPHRPRPQERDVAPDGETTDEFFDRMTRSVDESRQDDNSSGAKTRKIIVTRILPDTATAPDPDTDGRAPDPLKARVERLQGLAGEQGLALFVDPDLTRGTLVAARPEAESIATEMFAMGNVMGLKGIEALLTVDANLQLNFDGYPEPFDKAPHVLLERGLNDGWQATIPIGVSRAEGVFAVKTLANEPDQSAVIDQVKHWVATYFHSDENTACSRLDLDLSWNEDGPH